MQNNESKNKINDYNFHGHSLSISADMQILGALHARMTNFSVELDDTPNLVFDYEYIYDNADHPIKQPQGKSRIVYEAPVGNIIYVANEDKLYMNIDNKIRFLCDYEKRHTKISYKHAACNNPWLLSHGVFTVPFNEQLKRSGCYPLHAAGMSINGKGLLLPGTSGAGKSTLTVALLRAGFGFLGDDTIFLVKKSSKLLMLAFHDEIDITDKSISFFPELRNSEIPKLPGAPKHQLNPEIIYKNQLNYIWKCKPSVIVFPKVANSDKSIIKPFSKDEALVELVPNVLLTDPKSSQSHLDILADLVKLCDCYQLKTGRDFDALSEQLHDLLT